MKNKRRNLISNFTNGNSDLDKLVKRSTSATCGTFEREINVSSDRVSVIKDKLKSGGFMIIGTSEPGFSTRKIWFVRQGFGML